MIWVQNASPEVDAQSEWPLIVAVCITLSTIMTMCVALRLYVRTYMIKSLGTDDYVIIFSMVRTSLRTDLYPALIELLSFAGYHTQVYALDKHDGDSGCLSAYGQPAT